MSLHEAIEGGIEDLAASDIENVASVNDKDGKGDTALHIAGSTGSVATALLLLRRGADRDSRGAEQRTPLHRAGIRGHARMCYGFSWRRGLTQLIGITLLL